jgi:hypothetical protein
MGHLHHNHCSLRSKEIESILLRSKYELKNKELKTGDVYMSRSFINQTFYIHYFKAIKQR